MALSRQPLVALALILAILVIHGTHSVAGDQSPYNNLTLNVCSSAYLGFVYYGYNSDGSVNGTRYGYEIDLFQTAANMNGWNNYRYVDNLPWAEMMVRLHLPLDNRNCCHIAPTGAGVLATRINKGKQFSRPTYRAGLGIVVGTQTTQKDIWIFAKVFDWRVWVLLFCSSLGLAAVVYVAERDMLERGQGKTRYAGNVVAAACEAVYRVLGKVFNAVNDLAVSSTPAKLLAIAWSLLVVVLIATYTATLTANLTASNYKLAITSVSELPGLKVMSYIHYVNQLKKFGFIADSFNWEGDATAFEVIDMVAKGTYDAFILDEPFLRVAVGSRCDVQLVGTKFQYEDYATIFNANIDQQLIGGYNTALMYLEQNGTYNYLEDKYIYNAAGSCIYASTTEDHTVTLNEIGGVWITMSCGLGVAILIMLLPHISQRFDLDAAARMRESMSLNGAITGLRPSFSLRSMSATSRREASVRGVKVRPASMSPMDMDAGLPHTPTGAEHNLGSVNRSGKSAVMESKTAPPV